MGARRARQGSATTTEPSLWQRFLEWLRDLLVRPVRTRACSRRGASSSSWPWSSRSSPLVVVLTGPTAEPSTRRGRAAGAVVDDEGLSAADYRARAREATARGDWDAVLLDSYRALAAVGRGAHPAHRPARAHRARGRPGAGARLPRPRGRPAASATDFDAVRYGHRRTTEAKAVAATELDAALLPTRPSSVSWSARDRARHDPREHRRRTPPPPHDRDSRAR